MNKSEKFWDMIADNYDKTEKRFEQIHIKTVENSKKYLKTNDIVLDYGCATGTKAFELASNVKRIIGIDISSKMIESAKRKAALFKISNVDFEQSTIFNKRYKKESFDVILAFNIIHALKGNQQAIRRINKLLKSGGLFISVTPCLKEKMGLINRLQLSFYLLLIKIGLFPNILTRFKIFELENLIAKENFNIIRAKKLFHGVTSYFIVTKKI